MWQRFQAEILKAISFTVGHLSLGRKTFEIVQGGLTHPNPETIEILKNAELARDYPVLWCLDFHSANCWTWWLRMSCINNIKASEMLVAPRISECFDLPQSALVCYSLLTSSFAPFGRSGRYVCLHHPASPFSFFLLVVYIFVGYLFFRCYYLFVCLVGLFV